jgi:hypothetical protein
VKIINLLPKNRQVEFFYGKLFVIVLKLFWIMLFAFILVLLGQFGVKIILQSKVKKIEANISELQKFSSLEDNAKVKNLLTEKNALILDYKTLSQSIPKNSKVIRAFAPLVPEGVSIKQMKISVPNKQIEIYGYALTRELVIKLYDNLVEQKQLFPNIDYPLENVAKPTEINFHFTFNISPELLQ